MKIKKFFMYPVAVLVVLLMMVVTVRAAEFMEEEGEIDHTQIQEESRIEKLPPEPKEPPVVRQEIKELDVTEGKEVVLDVYTVQKGDYLSKIADREYGDNNLWKVIYGYNKYIKNSHWIFPGDRIILPVIVDKLPEVPEAPVEEQKEEEVKKEPREYKDFLAPVDFTFSATIIDFKVKKALQAQADYLFIDLGRDDEIKENQRLYIYRQGRSITHPYTNELIGEIYTKIGEIRITGDIEDYNSTAKIIYSHISIEKGDMLLLAE